MRTSAEMRWTRRLYCLRAPEFVASVEEPDALRLLTLNCFAVGLARRLPLLERFFKAHPAELIALQEVGPELRQVLEAGACRLLGSGATVLLSSLPVREVAEIELGPGKTALRADLTWRERSLRVVAAHLTSQRRPGHRYGGRLNGSASPMSSETVPGTGSRWANSMPPTRSGRPGERPFPWASSRPPR